MELFNTTLNQMAFLFLLILIGYGLRKSNFLPDNTAKVLSKLENAIFIPALVLRTFVENFTIAGNLPIESVTAVIDKAVLIDNLKLTCVEINCS